jgi:hypothetical protein
MPTGEQFFRENYPAAIADLALAARALLLSIAPQAAETVDGGHKTVVYGSIGGMMDAPCYISAHKAHINIGFMRGTDLPDPAGLLEGTGKKLRHVKIKAAEQLANPALHTLITVAFATPNA